MQSAAAVSILALTVGLSLTRPSLRHWQIQPPLAAVMGACLALGLGLVSFSELVDTLRLLRHPVITIISLMTMTLVVEQAGFFRLLAWRVATMAKGDGRKLFAYLFFAGTITGTFFTNDAAILIFTPMVFNLIQDIEDSTWTEAHKIPYYFAVLYIANLVGPLVISNPINIIVASLFDIGFTDYARWMLLPALVSIATSFLGLRFFFRHTIPATYRLPLRRPIQIPHRGFMMMAGVILSITLLGLFTEQLTGFPAWLVAATGAITLLAVYRGMTRSPIEPIVRGIGWDVIIFVIGIFIVATALRNAGMTDQIGRIIYDSEHPSLLRSSFVTGYVAAACSAIMNNHPTAGIMALAIQGLDLDSYENKILAFSALIGGDLGPKMLPIGSLAALLWFRMLRKRGVAISYRLYVRVGVPVTLLAIGLALIMLNLERLIAGLLR